MTCAEILAPERFPIAQLTSKGHLWSSAMKQSINHIQFPISVPAYVLSCFRNKATCWSRNVDVAMQPVFNVPLSVTPSKFCSVYLELNKSEVVKKCFAIHSAILMELKSATDRQTDKQTKLP